MMSSRRWSPAIGRLAAKEEARNVPSVAECRFRPIPRKDCLERIED